MNLLILAGKSVLGKRLQSFLTFCIVLTLFIAELTGFLLESAVKAAQNDTLRQIGIRLAVSPKMILEDSSYKPVGDQIINRNMLDSVMSMEHVTGISSALEFICTPLDFHNVKDYTGIDPSTQNEKADAPVWGSMEEVRDCIWLIGDLNLENQERFYKNKNYIIEGIFPNEENPGALISSKMSQQNGLKPGDIISVQGPAVDGEVMNTVSLRIQGIYETSLKFEITEDNRMGEAVWPYSPYNGIYTDYETARQIHNATDELKSLIVWADSPSGLKLAAKELQNDAMWKDFKVTDLTDIQYQDKAGQLEATGAAAGRLTVLFLVFGCLILFIILTFWGDAYIYDVSLYVMLGYKKWKIFFLQLLQAQYICVPGAVAALMLSGGIAAFLNHIIRIDFSSVNGDNIVYSFITGESDITQNFQVSLNIAAVKGMPAVLLAVSVVSALLPLFATCSVKPKTVVSSDKRG